MKKSERPAATKLCTSDTRCEESDYCTASVPPIQLVSNIRWTRSPFTLSIHACKKTRQIGAACFFTVCMNGSFNIRTRQGGCEQVGHGARTDATM
eukprot:364278-Prymnesium_polylepis.2